MTDQAIAYMPDGTEVVAMLAEDVPVTIGLNAGIPADIYHRLPGASQSQLKVIRDKSPAHLRYQLDHPPAQTDAQRLGAAVHDCVLLPDLFATSWVRGIPGDARTKAVQEARAQLVADHPNAVVLVPGEYDACLAIRDAIASHKRARALLVGDAEQSALWRDERTGALCRGRFDLLGSKSLAVTDLKTCRSAARVDFEKSIWTYGYHVQGAHYVAGAKTLGLPHDRFAFVAVESSPPYGVAVYELLPAALEDGARELQPLLDQYSWCLENNDWYCYSDDVEYIDLPPWAPRQIDHRLGEVAA